MPPVENLWKYTKMGFDLVAFSGGKGIRGPQSAGLLLGRKDLIEAARMNAPPNGDTIGRGMKVNKEEMLGMLVALELYLRRITRRNGASSTGARRRSGSVAPRARRQGRDLRARVANHVPHVRISWDAAAKGMTPADAVNGAAGRRAVDRHPLRGRRVVVGVWMMQPGEDKIVARRLRQVLEGAPATTNSRRMTARCAPRCRGVARFRSLQRHASRRNSLHRHEASRMSMACVYAIEAYGPDADALPRIVEEAFDEVDRIDRLMSHYKADSGCRASTARPRSSGGCRRGAVRLHRRRDALPPRFRWRVRHHRRPVDEGVGLLPRRRPRALGDELAAARRRVGGAHVMLNATAKTIASTARRRTGSRRHRQRLRSRSRRRNAQGAQIAAALISAGGSTIYGLGAPPAATDGTSRSRIPSILGRPRSPST